MPGYQLIEEKYLNPPSRAGIKRNSQTIGFLDFVREIKQEEFPYNENTKLLVVGLEEVLLYSRPDMEAAAREIRRKLQSEAGRLDNSNCYWVQIVFKSPLVRGEHLNVKYPGNVMIPIYLIFGSPVEDVEDGIINYRCSFNLQS